MLTGPGLAALNASLNSIAAILLLVGFVAIRNKQRERHRKAMLAAFVTSCLFLTSYLTRIALFGDTRFGGEGPVRYVYLAILISHVLLAMAVAPMAVRTLYLGVKGRYESHRGIARWTFPIWAYVSVTGVVVYLMLYQM